LEFALERMAGHPERVEGLAWYRPATAEPVRDERKRPW
jgi:hypothetical protein